MREQVGTEDHRYGIPGHPLSVLRQENNAVEAFIKNDFQVHLEQLGMKDGPEVRNLLLRDVDQLGQLELHYRKIDSLVMPHIVAFAGVAPQRVMLSIQRDVLRMIHALRDDLQREDSDVNGIRAFSAFLIRDIEIIIRQEREAYSQEARKVITDAQWGEIALASRAIGYCMIAAPVLWPPEK